MQEATPLSAGQKEYNARQSTQSPHKLVWKHQLYKLWAMIFLGSFLIDIALMLSIWDCLIQWSWWKRVEKSVISEGDTRGIGGTHLPQNGSFGIFSSFRRVIHISFTLLPLSHLSTQMSSIRLCWGQACFDLPPIPKFKFYAQRWRLAIGHFGQTNNHDWPQNYAANPSLTLPMAPGIGPHLQTAENPLVQNQKNLKESEAKVLRAQCAVSQFNGCSH